MKYPVKVAIHTTATDDQGEGAEDIRMICQGTMAPHEKNIVLLQYQEVMEDEGGETVVNDVMMRITPGHVLMMRKGPYGTTMSFRKGQRFEGALHTPFGDMDMALYPTRVTTEQATYGGRVVLDYQLDMNGSFGSMRHMQIEYRMTEEGMKLAERNAQ